MSVDDIEHWINDTLPQILAVLFLLAILYALIKILLNLLARTRQESGKLKMTKAQRDAEHEAMEKLSFAQRLLMESDENVEEAQKLRDEVVHTRLPKHRMYIAGSDPNSLLNDVDDRIRLARMRLYRKQYYDPTAEAGPDEPAESDEADIIKE